MECLSLVQIAGEQRGTQREQLDGTVSEVDTRDEDREVLFQPPLEHRPLQLHAPHASGLELHQERVLGVPEAVLATKKGGDGICQSEVFLAGDRSHRAEGAQQEHPEILGAVPGAVVANALAHWAPSSSADRWPGCRRGTADARPARALRSHRVERSRPGDLPHHRSPRGRTPSPRRLPSRPRSRTSRRVGGSAANRSTGPRSRGAATQPLHRRMPRPPLSNPAARLEPLRLDRVRAQLRVPGRSSSCRSCWPRWPRAGSGRGGRSRWARRRGSPRTMAVGCVDGRGRGRAPSGSTRTRDSGDSRGRSFRATPVGRAASRSCRRSSALPTVQRPMGRPTRLEIVACDLELSCTICGAEGLGSGLQHDGGVALHGL